MSFLAWREQGIYPHGQACDDRLSKESYERGGGCDRTGHDIEWEVFKMVVRRRGRSRVVFSLSDR